MIKAKLFVLGMEREVAWTNLEYHRFTNFANGKPGEMPLGGLISLSFISTQEDDKLLRWMTHTPEDKTCHLAEGKVVFYEGDFTGVPLFEYKFNDAALVNWEENFSADDAEPMTISIDISAAIQEIKGVPFAKPWKITDTGDSADKGSNEPIEKEAKIVAVDWVDESGTEISEIHYTQKTQVRVKLQNQKGGEVKVKITKKDNTEFETGKSEITLTATAKEGDVLLPKLEMKSAWEDLKKEDPDKLVAEAEYDGKFKSSSKLEIIRTPKVLVSFRPNDSWKGEFGFDWIREGDTSLFKDTKFEDIISKQYTDAAYTTLERNSNKYKGFFKKDEPQFKKLKNQYKPFEIDWKTETDSAGVEKKVKHCTEWLSLKHGDEAKVKVRIDVTDESDFLEFEDTTNFDISPKKIDIKGKSGTKTLTDEVTIKCKAEFAGDEVIEIKTYHEGLEDKAIVAGKINVWANQASNQKTKKVVFVEVTTDASKTGVPVVPDASNEKTRIDKYLNQAYIKLDDDSDIVSIDLSAESDFDRFVNGGRIMKTSRVVPAVPASGGKPAVAEIPAEKLVKYLKKKLKAADAKYDSSDYFKAFYFKENGYHASGNLSGYSQSNSDYVVVFKSANDQTAAHEFLHSFNLAHTFANSEASGNAEFTYEAKLTDNLLDYSHNPGNNNNRCSLYYWQWKKANNSIT